MSSNITRCENCFFSMQRNTLECHKKPPVYDPDELYGKFPVVEDLDWCGEYKPEGGE